MSTIKNNGRKLRRRFSAARRTPVRWYGGKTRLLPRLLPLFPHHTRYVSVFGGSGGDIYGKPRSKVEVYNDLSNNLHNFYAVLRNEAQRKKMCWLLEHTPASQRQFGECLNVVQSENADPVQRAWAFYFATQFMYAGLDPARSSRSNYQVSIYRGVPAKWLHCREHLEDVARRFRSVLIEHSPWQYVVEKYDEVDTFYYLDPPYVHSARKSTTDYECEMSDEQHLELLARLQSIKGFAMISGYDSELYRNRLRRWRRAEFSVLCTASSHKKKPTRTEIVWLNYTACGARIRTA